MNIQELRGVMDLCSLELWAWSMQWYVPALWSITWSGDKTAPALWILGVQWKPDNYPASGTEMSSIHVTIRGTTWMPCVQSSCKFGRGQKWPKTAVSYERYPIAAVQTIGKRTHKRTHRTHKQTNSQLCLKKKNQEAKNSIVRRTVIIHAF